MSRTHNQRTQERRRPAKQTPHVEATATAPAAWLSGIAFGLLVAVVIARLMMLESLRNPLAVGPGSQAVPGGPGPTAGLALDLLACVPALLVLARRWLDPKFALRVAWSFVPLGGLGLWAVVSTTWASDKFAALVSSIHLLSAFVALWAAAQVVRSWLHLRLLAGLCYGVLLMLVVHGAYFLAMERPGLQEEWRQHGDELLRQRGIQPGSFDALQFSNKVLHGELMGFNASPNTYAALLVLTMIVTVGVAIERYRRTGREVSRAKPVSEATSGPARESKPPGDDVLPYATPTLRLKRPAAGLAVTAALALLLVVAPATWMVWLAQSRTAYVTPFLAFGILATIAIAGKWMARRAKGLYWLGVACVALGTAALVGHGMYHGTLFHDSLNFRWRYWVGAFRLFRLHPLLGVGWENFGHPYLATRLPTATEEIADPHNFLVRFFAELGLVGGGLALAWVLRLWWELTRPVAALAESDSTVSSKLSELPTSWMGAKGIAAVLGVGIVGTLLNVFASIDFTAGGSFVTLELFRRALFLTALLVGAAAVCLRANPEVELDDRPVPWVLYALVAGLAVFFVHNLIDFSLFEVGALFFFALLAGADIGARSPGLGEPHARGRKAAVLGLAAGGLAWLVVAGAVLVPVGLAESASQDGDELVRQGNLPAGAVALESAFRRLPINADYAFRAAEAWRLAGQPDKAKAMFDAAAAADPSAVPYYVARAELSLARGDAEAARTDYAQAVARDPNNLQNRIRLGETLERLNRPIEAAEAYQKTLWYNDQLTPEEKKRLAEDKVQNLRQRIARLRGSR